MYDGLEWHFIKETLEFFKFPTKLVNVIMNCICRSKLAIHINGSPLNWIFPSRDIQQGDPLSPYICILCMASLSLKIQKEVEDKEWKPLQLVKRGHHILHTLFGDDIMLYGEADETTVLTMRKVLQDFL